LRKGAKEYKMSAIYHEDEETEDDSKPLLRSEESLDSRRRLPRIHTVLGYILFLILGISPQVIQNAMFSETPIFEGVTPEGKQITSYIVTSFMVANVFCLLYLVIQQWKPVNDKIIVYIILFGSIVDAVLIMFLWTRTAVLTWLGNTSYMLLVCGFIGGALGNTSTLVFFALVTNYQPVMTTALSAGYGLSGLITSALSIAQTKYNFSVKIFFVVNIAVIVSSILSFAVLVHSSIGKSLEQPKIFSPENINGSYRKFKRPKLISYIWLSLLTMFWVSILTFYVPGMIPYMTEKSSTMNYLNGIFLVFPPVGAAIAGLFKIYFLPITAILQTLVFAYILVPVFQPGLIPLPEWLLYLLMIVFSLFSGYNTTMVYLRARRDLSNPLAIFDSSTIEKVTRYIALSNQIGAMVGIFVNDGIIKSHLYHTS